MTDIAKRLGRLHAAVGQTIDTNLENFPATLGQSSKARFVYQDFRGGQSDEELEIILQSLIANIASLFGHLRHWARSTARGVDNVDEAFNRSLDLRIIMDLWNSDKHPGESRKGGYSKKRPKLANISSVMKMTARAGQGATVMTLGVAGKPVCNVPGASRVVVTADVLDERGNNLGEINDMAERAIQVWEKLVDHLQ